MSKFFKKMAAGAESLANKVAADVAKPLEIGWLDEIVARLLGNYNNFVEAFVNDGTPPTLDQAREIEEQEFRKLNDEYNHKSQEKCGRSQHDDQDVIAVRRRMLNRGLEARAGKLYSKFSGEVSSLTELAAATLRRAVDIRDEVGSSIKAQLPLTAEAIQHEIGAMNASVTDQVNSSFPEGIVGLDNYDDALPDGIPSWKGFQETVAGLTSSLLYENSIAVENAKAIERESLAKLLKDEIDAAIHAAVEKIRDDLKQVNYSYLTEEENVGFLASLVESTNEYELSRV